MKTETKIKLFSLYINQSIVLWDRAVRKTQLLTDITLKTIEVNDRYSLLLRTIDQLTDEENIKLIKFQISPKLLNGFELVKFSKKYKNIPLLKWKFIPDNDKLIVDGKHSYCEDALLGGSKDLTKLSTIQYNYLIQIGIALPFYSIDEDKIYSVEEQINEGIIKIKS